MMSEQRITTYVKDGEEYDVILLAKDDQRASAQDLTNIYVRSEQTGELVPLANLIRVEERAGPGTLNRYNRLRSVTLSASLAPGAALGDALDFLERVVRESFPDQAQIDYQGESLEYREASGSLAFMFGLALLIVFLVLAAQFESFVHPFVILVTVPLAITGALIGLYVTGATINIYSQIGVVMLIGIAAKNGVLIVEFINQRRDAGLSFEDAIIDASGIRLRPGRHDHDFHRDGLDSVDSCDRCRIGEPYRARHRGLLRRHAGDLPDALCRAVVLRPVGAAHGFAAGGGEGVGAADARHAGSRYRRRAVAPCGL